MKKKYLVFLLCLAVLAPGLTACGASEPAQTAAPAAEAETPAPESMPSPVALPNPIHETDAQGLVQATGIPLPAPEGAKEVRYSYLELTGEAPIAQMDFELDGAKAYLRAQSFAGTEPADISGLYYDWTESAEAEVKYCRARVYTNGEAGYIAWVDVVPGLLYNLGMTGGADAGKLVGLANAAFYPVQGDVDGDETYKAYDELISKVRQGLREGRAEETVNELGISDVFKRADPASLGWLQRDINGDGTAELLFGENGEGKGSPVFDIFSMLSGELIHPASGWEFNRWFLLEDGILVNEASNSGFDTVRTAYGLFNGKLIPANRIVDPDEYLTLDFRSFAE